MVLKTQYTRAQINGADGFKILSLSVRFDGIDAIITMDVIRYNGR